MLYVFLCYNDEDEVFSRSQAEDRATIDALSATLIPLEQAARFALGVQLMTTTTAATVRLGRYPPVVLDGPCCASRRQLLQLYMIECEDLEAALIVATDIARASCGGEIEVRPSRWLCQNNCTSR